MKYSGLLIVLILVSCTGTLSDEQRKRIKESIAQGEIKKVSEAQVTEAAFVYGRQIASTVEKKDKSLTNKFILDSLGQAFQVEIIAIQSSNQNLRKIEKQLLEAYLVEPQANDNIQKIDSDSLLYTKPLMREHPDGSTEFLKALGIRMTKKQIVLTIK